MKALPAIVVTVYLTPLTSTFSLTVTVAFFVALTALTVAVPSLVVATVAPFFAVALGASTGDPAAEAAALTNIVIAKMPANFFFKDFTFVSSFRNICIF